MAKRTEQGQRDQDIYHGVLGYLSEDAQAALFKYLPYMEDRVNDEVVQFGRQLADDLRAAVDSESSRARKRLEKAKKGVQEFECFAKKGKAGLGKRQLPIEQVAQAASALNRMVCEGTALLGRMQAFGKQVAQYAVQRTPERLQLAVDDLERAHHVWCVEVAHVDKAICVAKQADATQQDATQEDATQKDAELGQIKSLIADLKSRVRSLGSAARAQPYAEKEVPSRWAGAPHPAAEARAAAASAEAEERQAAQAAARANATKAEAAARAAAAADAAARAEEAKARTEAQEEEAARAAADAEAAARAAEDAAASAAAEAAEMPESASERMEAAASAAAGARATAGAAKDEALRAAARLEAAESAAEAARATASAAKDEEAKATAAAESAAVEWAAAKDKAARAVAAELTELTWMLPALLERVQQQRTNALAEATRELQEQAAAAVKVISEWPSELERLLSCAEEIKQAAKDLPDDFASALKACIERASLDVRGR